MGMSSFDALLEEVVATMDMKGPYAAIEKLEALKAEGNVEATACLGRFYLQGIGVIEDVETGVDLLEEAANAGCPQADVSLGRLFLFGESLVSQDASKGLLHLEKAANAGLSEAMGILGDIYFYGYEGLETDPEKGLEWGMRAAKLGDITGHLICGDAYFYGTATAENIPLATYHYREVLNAEPENTNVMCNLAVCLADPTDDQWVMPTQADLVEALGLLSRAVELGDVRAHFNLGIHYANGVGVDQDYDLAHHYIELAANNGYEPAQEALGSFRRTMRGKWTL
ncbi:sel1 repeat family protein [Olsenella sp. KGMB02461]|nr:sel1 repeat family protein [Olsenella sp. KGMB02461]